jgi:predicted permease
LTAILSIALAIGANSTIFSYADGLLLRPMPVPNPSDVVVLRSVPPSVSVSVIAGTGQSRLSYPDFEDFRSNMKSFEGLVAYDQTLVAFARDPNSAAESRMVCMVSADFFRTLHVEPQIGRGFRPDEDEVPGRDPVIVLSHEFWRNELGGDASVIGRQVRLNNIAFTVIGVAPDGFTGVDPVLRQEFYIPIAMGPKLYPSNKNLRTDRNLRWFLAYGRLKQGISIRAAAREAAAFAASLEKSFPATNRGFGATVSTERELRLASWPLAGGLVGALFTLAVVILLIACANVANLMLARGRAREREIAVRLAIGASRLRLMRLLLIESVLISVVSGALAVIAAQFSLGILSNLEVPSDLPIFVRFQIDARTLWFTVLVSGLSALLFGLVPALQSTRADLASAMKAGESGYARSRLLGSYALVIVQIAGTMILLVLTTQGRRNFDHVLSRNPGFRVDHRITMRFNPDAVGYDEDKTRIFYDRLVEKAAETPGVKSAALSSGLPLTYDPTRVQAIPEGYEFPAGRDSVQVLSTIVDHHYFDTFTVPILAGRGFQVSDRVDSPRVALVNQTFASEYLGGNPLGKRMRLRRYDSSGALEEFAVEVIGVTMTGKTFLLTEPPTPAIYLPFSQNLHERMTLIAETTDDPASMAAPLLAVIQSLDPNMPIFRVRTMQDIFERSSVAMIRAVVRIYDLAAGMGLVMALVGLYAVVSYQVTRRTREIGIRMAIGARRIQVVRLFVQHALMISVIGVGMGLVLSIFANRLSESALGIENVEPTLMAAVSIVLLITTLVAALIPARRAAHVDPQRALRQD